MKSTDYVHTEREEEASIINLNDDKSFNSLSHSVLGQLLLLLKEADMDRKTKLIIIRGQGRGFSAGHNLKEVQQNDNEDFYQDLMNASSKLMSLPPSLNKPVIAEVHGVATAAGCQLVAACDLAYASSEAKFATPGVNIGLFCHTPLVPVSRSISKKHSMEMLLLGEMIDAAEAKRFGLINDVFEPSELHLKVMEKAKTIASKSPYVVQSGKRTFYDQLEMNLSEAYEYSSGRMVENLMANDAKEGINAFLNKKKPRWENSENID